MRITNDPELMSMEDSGWVKATKLTTLQIAKIFNIPPDMQTVQSFGIATANAIAKTVLLTNPPTASPTL